MLIEVSRYSSRNNFSVANIQVASAPDSYVKAPTSKLPLQRLEIETPSRSFEGRVREMIHSIVHTDIGVPVCWQARNLTGHSRPEVRKAVVKTLSELGHHDRVIRLLYAMSEDTQAEIRQAVFNALRNIIETCPPWLVYDLSTSPLLSVRYYCIERLATIRDPKSVAYLALLCNDKDHDIGLKAARALYQLNREVGLAALERLQQLPTVNASLRAEVTVLLNRIMQSEFRLTLKFYDEAVDDGIVFL